MRSVLWKVSVLWFTLLLPFVSAESEPVMRTLDNGLKVVVQENRTAPVVALNVYVRAGSVYEGKYLGSGISHYVEHLVSGGTTESRSEDEITRILERMGNANNAYTSRGHTAYYITTAPEHLEEAINMYADWMQNCTFAVPEVERERGVILEEIRKGDEEPSRVLQKVFYDTMFRRHPARHPIIGYEELFREITREDILSYYDALYAPDNMIVVVVGDIDSERVFEVLEDAFTDFKRHNVNPSVLSEEPAQLGKRTRHICRDSVQKGYFQIGFHTVALDDPDLYALDVLSHILSRGRSSRLVDRLQEDLQLVSSISSYSYTPSYGAGVLGIRGGCSPENLEVAIEETLNVLYELRDNPVSEEELATAKRQKVADNAFSRRTAEGMASELGINVLGTGDPSFTDVYLEGIESVTADDIMEVARCYLHDSNLNVVTLGPDERAPESLAISETQDQKPGKVEKVTLENGLRVLVKPTPANPLVHMQWLSLGGTRLEPPEKAGLSRITSHLFTRGASDVDAAGIARKFDSMGGHFSPVSGNNTLGVEVNVMKDNFAEAFDLFADMVRRPVFPEDQLESVRKRTLLAIRGRRDDWQSELTYLFNKKFFEKSPYRYGTLGEEQTVKAVTREDVISFYEDHVIPSRSVLTVFGNVDVAEAIEMARGKFGDMPPVDTEEPRIESELPKGGETIKVPVARQISAVMMGYPGMRVTDTEDRFAMHVLDAVLSGIGYPGGWLQEALRGGDRDLAYVVHAFNFMGLEPGYFGIMAASTPDKMDRVIEIIEEKVGRMKAGEVSTEELESAKNMCITMQKLQNQTNADMALQRGLNELYGLGYEFPEMFEKRINDITVRDVQRVAREYLNDPVILRLDGGLRIPGE